jgi:Arc/MetJ-type ribon-helix-helix transcriptional regulator
MSDVTIDLSPALEALVAQHLSTGRYASAEDLLAVALMGLAPDLTSDEVLSPERVAEMREQIEAGWASAEAGRLADGEAYFQGRRAAWAARRQAAK